MPTGVEQTLGGGMYSSRVNEAVKQNLLGSPDKSAGDEGSGSTSIPSRGAAEPVYATGSDRDGFEKTAVVCVEVHGNTL
jgi:hypothetical protein